MKTLIKTVLVALMLFVIYLPTNAQISWLKPVVSITGNVIDKDNEQAVGLKIYILNKDNKKIAEYNSSDIDGSYFITGLKANTDYTLSYENNGYVNKTFKIHTPNIDFYKEIVMDIYVKSKVKKEELQSQKM